MLQMELISKVQIFGNQSQLSRTCYDNMAKEEFSKARARRYDGLRCFTIVSTSVFYLPFTLFLFVLSILFPWLFRRTISQRKQCRASEGFQERTILVTGVGTAEGLTLARAFYLCGHRVIGADVTSPLAPCPSAHSKALDKFINLPSTSDRSLASTWSYVDRLDEIVESEYVDLWVSCSGARSRLEDAQAKDVIERQMQCICIQFDERTTSALHEKDTFTRIAHDMGLSVPETHDVYSHEAVFRVLREVAFAKRKVEKKRYVLKPLGGNDKYRGDMTLLPLAGGPATTAQHVRQLPISEDQPWILQRFIPGAYEYCTHALVLDSQVRAFVACPSTKQLMHFTALDAQDPRSKLMLQFTQKFVASWDTELTGHLSFNFMVGYCSQERKPRIYAIECNPQAHTAVVLFADPGRNMEDMVAAYLSALDRQYGLTRNYAAPSEHDWITSKPRIAPIHPVTPPDNVQPRYWIGHDLFTSWSLKLQQKWTSKHQKEMVDHLMYWKDGTFEWWDLVPFLELYHVYWPLRSLEAWWNGSHRSGGM